VFVTEFDLGHNDDVIRADWFEDAMRGFFAHPALKGHIMWGFWDVRMRYDNQYLIYGPKFKVYLCDFFVPWGARGTG
jgi:endo-1,4-beta-xylanase